MQNPLQQPLLKLERAIHAAKPELVHAIGVAGLNFIHKNFEDEGFNGTSFVRWKDRVKTPKGGRYRKILTGAGTAHLKNSFTQTDHATHTTISSDIPYARIHNEGGTINMPSRSVILNFRNARGGRLRLGKVLTEAQQRKITQLRRATVPAHSISMPARTFAADSPVLRAMAEKAVITILIRRLNNI